MNETAVTNTKEVTSDYVNQIVYRNGIVPSDVLLSNLKSNIYLDYCGGTNFASVSFGENTFDDSVNVTIITNNGEWGFSLSGLGEESLTIEQIESISLTENRIIVRLSDGYSVSLIKDLVKIEEQSIELDAPPGEIPLQGLLVEVLKGTLIPERETNELFGHYKWDYNDVPKSVWERYQKLFEERITELRKKGYIYYGNC